VLLDGDQPPGSSPSSSSSPPSSLSASSGAPGLSDSGFSCLLAAVFSVMSPWRCSELVSTAHAQAQAQAHGRDKAGSQGKVAVTTAEASNALLKVLGRLLQSKRSARTLIKHLARNL